MNHQDFEQFKHTLPDGQDVWITLCTCGKAFFDAESDGAYEMWEEHEGDY